MKKWYQSRTLWASIVTFVSGVGLFFTGEQEAMELALAGVAVVFGILRAVTESKLER